MPSDSFRFFVFTCRGPESDFRLPLVDALRHRYQTYYIWLRRRPVVSGPDSNNQPVEMSVLALFRFLRRFRRDDRTNVYFNSTNTYFPTTMVCLRLLARPGIWCLDMHDDLRYHNTGLKRWRESSIISLLRRISHVTMHAAPTLQELFPDSQHLGNASDIAQRPIGTSNDLASNDQAADTDVLILASFDGRFDFDFLDQLAAACPRFRFHLHGWAQFGDVTIQAKIESLAARHPNVRYHGAYTMAELPGILSQYRISVAPYRMGDLLTRYIDPLRFYHCLNAGLEVVSTDIPQARYMEDQIHVVSDVTTCAETLTAIRAGRLAKQPAYTPITWEQRAERLVEIIRSKLPQ